MSSRSELLFNCHGDFDRHDFFNNLESLSSCRTISRFVPYLPTARLVPQYFSALLSLRD